MDELEALYREPKPRSMKVWGVVVAIGWAAWAVVYVAVRVLAQQSGECDDWTCLANLAVAIVFWGIVLLFLTAWGIVLAIFTLVIFVVWLIRIMEDERAARR